MNDNFARLRSCIYYLHVTLGVISYVKFPKKVPKLFVYKILLNIYSRIINVMQETKVAVKKIKYGNQEI